MSEDRLINIETQFAFLEQTVSELNTQIYEQQKQIEKLEKAKTLLAQRLQAVSEKLDATEVPPANDPPPHY